MTSLEKLEQLLTTPEQKKQLIQVKKGITNLQKFNKALQERMSDLEIQNENLMVEIQELDSDAETYTTVFNPMGKVEYRVTGSLAIVQFMEEVEQRIIKL